MFVGQENKKKKQEKKLKMKGKHKRVEGASSTLY